MPEVSISVSEKVREILSTWSQEKIVRMKSVLQSDSKIARGVLINSFAIEVKADSRVQINFADYGINVNDGRAPGSMPPIQDIKDWCSIKGIPESAAFPIAKSIEKYGIEPTNFIDEVVGAIEELAKIIADEVSVVMIEGIKEKIEESNTK